MMATANPRKHLSKLRELEDGYIECRTRRHRFDPIPDPGGAGRKYQESKSVARLSGCCGGCGLVREEAWNRIPGAILFVNYRSPKGYSLAGPGSKPWDVRKESLARLNGKQPSLVTRQRRAAAKTTARTPKPNARRRPAAPG